MWYLGRTRAYTESVFKLYHIQSNPHMSGDHKGGKVLLDNITIFPGLQLETLVNIGKTLTILPTSNLIFKTLYIQEL